MAKRLRPKVPDAAPRPAPGGRRDPRRWIYFGFDLAFAVIYAVVFFAVVPNRLPSAAVHLGALPILAALMGLGMFLGGRRGWRIAIGGASLLLSAAFLVLVRILVSAAFLAGVY